MKYKGFIAELKIIEGVEFPWEGRAIRIIEGKAYTLLFADKTLLEAYKDFKEGVDKHYGYLEQL